MRTRVSVVVAHAQRLKLVIIGHDNAEDCDDHEAQIGVAQIGVNAFEDVGQDLPRHGIGSGERGDRVHEAVEEEQQ